jgi:hypothetical protein
MRILVQESPKSELWLQRCGEKKLEGPICNFWKWLGLYLEIFSKIKGSSWNFMDHGFISQKARGLTIKWWGFSWCGFIF